MKDIDTYIKILIDSCKSTIEQMTRIQVNRVEQRQVLKDLGPLPFAHIISYSDCDRKIDGEFVLGFESVNDALKLASCISDRLGIGKFDKICDDSTDLLNEFLNVVVGRTISEWDSVGLHVKFGTPVFKKKYKAKGSRHLKGYLISMDVFSDNVDLEDSNPVDQILLRVNFTEKSENKIENKRILLAEDSRVMRRIIGDVLKGQGALIKEAQDGEEAIKVHRRFTPDLTLMDINMPKLNGFDAIARIQEFSPDAKFIILSSSSKKDEIISAKTLNVSGYLVKPVEPEKLIQRVSAIL